ncbi:MAG: HlyD family efflux transporter periplasmic adaptor subunit [Oscillospiraceae bacterium]
MNSDTSKVLAVILVIFLLTTVINVAYHSFAKQYKTETAIAYSTSNKATFNGVYIRDEQVLTFDGGGIISYAVSDGGKLSKNSVVAYIYATEQDIEIKQDIAKLQNELDILVKIQNPGTTEVAQPSNLSSLIEEKYLNISYNKELGNMSKVQANKSELLVLLSTMQIVTDPESSFQGRIDELNSQISELESKLSNPISTIWVDKPSYFISYIDGYENTLSTSSMYNLTVDDIQNINDEVENLNTTNVVGKLIDDYKWYMVGVIDNSKKTFNVGDRVNLKLESSMITTHGDIVQIKDTENPNESIVYIMCNQMVESLVQHRVETVEMSVKNYEGIRVPREALRFVPLTETDENGIEKVTEYEGVYIKVGEKYQFKKIDVIYRADDYVISKASADNDYLSLYDDIILESVG